MENARDAVVVALGRSPMCRANKGSFAAMHPVEYAGLTLAGVLDHLPGFGVNLIDDVVVAWAPPASLRWSNINIH